MTGGRRVLGPDLDPDLPELCLDELDRRSLDCDARGRQEAEREPFPAAAVDAVRPSPTARLLEQLARTGRAGRR